MRRISGLFFILCFVFCACTKKNDPLFLKIPSSVTNIDFSNTLVDTPELNILTYLYYYNGAGVAAADFNNDGLIDLYFTANQGPDKIYLNKGDFTFEDITQQSGIHNTTAWTTGVTHIDINNDGLLDIYICKIGDYRGITGQNLLYINQGVNAQGIPTFKEDAKAFGLDFSGFSTQASFFDYDLDGDLDLFLLNHSVHPSSNYGKGKKRTEINSVSGDKLFRNDNGFFTDASEIAGIFQGSIGYGLGLSVSDVNNDGYPDIYVGNDFFENDYLYINQKNGTFYEVISKDSRKLGHTTHFSMGNDIADINNDGLTDILSLDMLPEDLETYKTSGLEYDFPTYQYYLKNGYAPQYMQNTLHLNLGNSVFSEVASVSGIAATEWSWGALFADYDNDGFKDLFISNGIKGATNDMDFINFIANDHIQNKINKGMSTEDLDFIDKMPEKKVPNYFFKNNTDLTFQNTTSTWYLQEDTFSNGAIYADLDNDGDLDIVVNNVNENAHVLKNVQDQKLKNNALSIRLKGNKTNPFGIGAKLIGYQQANKIVQEHFPSRGYLSAVSNSIHLGLGKDATLDSLQIVWPGGLFQTLKTITTPTMVLDIANASGNFYTNNTTTANTAFALKDSLVRFKHQEATTIEFDRDPLVPFANTNQGPMISVADTNGDGLEDVFISGAKAQASALFMQDSLGVFTASQQDLFLEDALNEDTSQVFFDANGDSFPDLLVVSGGNEFKSSKTLQPRLYINEKGVFKKSSTQFSGIELNASAVDVVDFDNDGDLDVTIVSDQVPQQFGKTPKQYLFRNDGHGNFIEVTQAMAYAIEDLGNVKDFLWVDIDQNGYKDLIAVGYWMPISIFTNNGTTLNPVNVSGLETSHGWWNTIIAEDFDQDGDIDLVAGNWGKNSKFSASIEKPITLYSSDFDENGSIEPLVTYFHKNKETPFASKDELVKQMPFLNKKFLSYKNFAAASITELFGAKKLKAAYKKKTYELASCYFENDGSGNFIKKELPFIAQTSSVTDMMVEDFNNDGLKDLILIGNIDEISTQLGRLDAMHGIVLNFTPNGNFQWDSNIRFPIDGPARSIQKLKVQNEEHYIVGINNDKPIIFKKAVSDKIQEHDKQSDL